MWPVPGAGPAAHRGDGGKDLVFGYSAWNDRGRQAALCPDSEGMGTQGSSEVTTRVWGTCSALLLGEKATETVLSYFLPSGKNRTGFLGAPETSPRMNLVLLS